MAALKNEEIYFVKYLLIHMRYFDGSDVQCDVFEVKKFEYDVQMGIISVADR